MTFNLVNDSALKIAQFLTKLKDSYFDGIQSQSNADLSFRSLIEDTNQYNPWYTKNYMIKGLDIFIQDMIQISLQTKTPQVRNTFSKKIGFISYSGRPFEDLSEIVYTALLGFDCKIRVLPENQFLLRKLLEVLELFELQIREEENFKDIQNFVSFGKLTKTAREYFVKYNLLELPGNGTSLIITGNEANEALKMIVESICLFFGRSKRNIKLLFIPDNYDINRLQIYLNNFSNHLYHNRYYNNYEYRKSTMLINRSKFVELPPLLITESLQYTGYLSVIPVLRYKNKQECISNEIIKHYPLISNMEHVFSLADISAMKPNYATLIKFISTIRE